MSGIGKLFLKKGREKPVLRLHPWIFSGAVADIQGKLAAGATVEVRDYRGDFLAYAAYSPDSQIRARIWSWDSGQEINADFFQDRLEQSVEFRRRLGLNPRAIRWVHAESDRLPGLIADQYGDVLVLQLLSAGAEYWRDVLCAQLVELTGVKTVYERSDVEVRNLEGLSPRTGLLHGADPDALVPIQEHQLSFLVDVVSGHKTGFYLDQRDNRKLLRDVSQDRTVLDCFCYTGGFAIHAAAGGARSITMVDSSADALSLAEKNLARNQLSDSNPELIEGDVFAVLRKFRDQDRKFEIICLDPPKFAPTASHAQQAARGYKDINLLALKLLEPGGMLFTFSCSGGIDEKFFLRILSGAARDAEVNARMIKKMWQSADHSINLRFPEGSYLKGFIILVE